MFSQLMRRLPFVGGRLPSLSMLMARDQSRHLPAWFRSRRENYLLDHAIPWITFDATEYLRANLRRGIRVFEYGSGASTLFWARYDADCIAIEHDPTWVETLRARLDPAMRVDLRLVPPDDPPLATPADLDDPAAYRSDWIGFERSTFRNYVSQIDSFPDAHFDVVMIDGHARPSCIAHSYRKVKPGGMLVLDNADVAPYLARVGHHLAAFERLSFPGIAPIVGVLSQTDVYIAPLQPPG